MSCNFSRDFRKEAREDAADIARLLSDQIVSALIETGETSTFFYDYDGADETLDEETDDGHYSLIESAHLIDQLDDHEETDSGTWEGVKDPEEAVFCKAYYTYRNAVRYFWGQIIEAINEDETISHAVEAEPPSWEGEDEPPLDEGGKPLDDVLAAMLVAGAEEAGDYAQDTGSKFATQLQAGCRVFAFPAALERVVTKRVYAVIEEWLNG